MPTDAARAYESLIQFLYRAPIGLVQTDLDGAVEMLNPMSAQLLMPLAQEGDLDNLFVTLQDAAPQLRVMTSAFQPSSGIICDAFRFDVADARGSPPKALSISLLKLDSDSLMAVLADVTVSVERERQGIARQLQQAARVDTLTGIPNRTAICERLGEVLALAPRAAGHEFAVLYMNCDRFEQVNHTLGHAGGDEVLGLLADRLRSTLRHPGERSGRAANEALVARVGGDEFAVVLDDLRRPDDVHAVAQRLAHVLAQPYGVGSQQVSCPVSMGVVLRAQAGSDAEAVLQDANIAMTEAKRAGGSGYAIFEPPMRERAAHRGDIEAGLRRALSEGELFVVYQPVVGLQDASGIDRSAGVEALVRWRHPTRGIVPPIEFIGIAEECGLIGDIGDFVLATSCNDFVRWQRDLGVRAPRLLAVNMSRAQVAQRGWDRVVRQTLDACGMTAGQLQLEVTESLAAQDEQIQERLHELKALGLKLALDDFGTGYSSLASLHLLPVDTVKIDRSFVSHSATSHHHRVLIDATVRVAQSLAMNTVAEGIETDAQATIVRQLGCDKGQGYLFSRPLPEAELRHWLGR